MEEFRVVDIWVGRFQSENDFDAYLEEVHSDEEGVPLSRFAADQNQTFYDHDFIEAGFRETTVDFSNLIEGHSFADSYMDAASDAFKASRFASANAVVLVFGQEIHNPRSVERSSYSLTYLGRFDCSPDTATQALGDDEPPSRIHLLIVGDEILEFNGKLVSSIPVDSRGLIIGLAGPNSRTPRLDVSGFADAVAEDQVKVYRDQFDQWIIEDVGSNGLTRIDNEELAGRTFPWHGKRLAVGTLEFQWSTRGPESAS